MNRRHLEFLLWIVAVFFAGAAYVRWRGAAPPQVSTPAIDRSVPRGVPRPDSARLARHLALAASENPFRLDRTPAPVPFGRPDDPAALAAAAYAPPPPPPFRPPLAVSGLVGPPWVAVLEGVPDRDRGIPVREGDRLGQLRIRSVSPAGVVVQGPDTIWRLTVRRTWQ